MEKYIFLDFDGVLNIHGKKTFYRAQHFAEIVAPIPNVKIVFSTSWREYSTLEKLTAYLPASIHDKCVGMTPVIKHSMKYPRYHEILLYADKHNISKLHWLALDDMACLFPPQCENLILVNSKIGFSKQEAKKIKDFCNENSIINNISI